MPPHADVLQWEHLPFPKSLREPPPDLNDIHALLATPCGCEFWLEDENSHEQSENPRTNQHSTETGK